MTCNSEQQSKEKKHKKSELFTPKFLDSLRGALKAAPQKAPSRLTKKDIVMALKDEIFDLVERGYSYGNICDILGDKNFKISPISLRKYLREIDPSIQVCKAVKKTELAPVAVEVDVIDAEFVTVEKEIKSEGSFLRNLVGFPSLKLNDYE